MQYDRIFDIAWSSFYDYNRTHDKVHFNSEKI